MKREKIMNNPKNIETYDRFCKELWPQIRKFEYDEPIFGAMRYCRKDAINELNEDLLAYMLCLDDNERILTLLERERNGDRCLPDYVWRAFREWLTNKAKRLTDQAEYLEHDKFTKRKNELWQEHVRLRRRVRKLGDVAKKRCIFARIRQISSEIDPYPILKAYGFGDDCVSNMYFDGEEIQDRQKFIAALRDLSGKILNYATQFKAN